MTNFDDDLERVLDVLLESPGQRYDVGDPGEVLSNLANEADVDYKRTSLIVIRLEMMGWVHVDRQCHDEPRRANKICSIEVVD